MSPSDEPAEYGITITASTPFAQLVAQLLEDDGIEVRYPDGFEWPMEQRGLPGAENPVVVFFYCYGAGKAIDAVIARVQQRWPTIKVFVEERRRSQGPGGF